MEGGTGEASSSSVVRRLAVNREGGCDRGGVVFIRAAEARGLPGERVGPGRCHSPGGGGSRSTGRDGGTGEAWSSSGRRWLADHLEGARGWDRGGVVILRAVEARGPLGGRGGSRSTGREGGTGEVSSSSGQRRLAVHREGGRDRVGVILRVAVARGPPGGRVGPGRCRNPQCGGGSWSTGWEGGSGKASSSGRRGHAVHREGGWDRGGVVIFREAEARGPPGGRAGPGRRHPPGGGGSRSTGRDGGTGEALSFGRRRHAVHREGGWDRGGVVILRAGEASGPPGEGAGPGRRNPPGGGGSRSTERDGGTGEVWSFSGRRRLAVHRERGWDRGGVIFLAAEARGPTGGRAGPGRRRHPPGGGG